jgi:hypothetical protein
LCHQIPSITTTPGRVSSVTAATNWAAPRSFSTFTGSPSRIPRAAASSGFTKTMGAFWRRRRSSDWLKDEFRKKRFGGTRHWRGKRCRSSSLSGPSRSGV